MKIPQKSVPQFIDLAVTLTMVFLASSCVQAQDTLVTPQQSFPLFRNTEGTSIVVELGPKLVDRTLWFSLDSAAVGELTAETVSSDRIRTFHFPEVKSLDVSLAVEVTPQTQRVRLTSTKPWPPALTYKLSGAVDPSRSISVNDDLWSIRLPDWTVKKDWLASLALSWDSQSVVKLSFQGAGAVRSFEIPTGDRTVRYYPEAWSILPRSFTVRSADLRWKSISLEPTAPGSPILADTATLLNWPAQLWRNSQHEWFRWEARPNVLVLVTQDYAVQDKFLKRLAFFVEKTGFQGKLWQDSEIAPHHGWNAHDYSSQSLSEFFNRAVEENFPLNDEELEIKSILIENKILLPAENGKTSAGDGAILGISVQSAPFLRAFLLTHEAFHGFYFTSPEYRDLCHAVWNQLPSSTKRAMRTFLAASQYDSENEELMVNEFQAYCLQQPASEWEAFFHAKVLHSSRASASEKRVMVDQFVASAQALRSFVEKNFRVTSGNVMNVMPIP